MSFSKESYLIKLEIRNSIYFVLFFFWLVFSYSLYTAFYQPIFLTVAAVFLGALVFNYFILRGSCSIRFMVFLSLALSQIVWIFNIAPLNHWTVGALLLIVYFIFWDILRLKLREILTRRLITRDIVFGAGGIILVLLSSRIIV